MAWTLEGRNGLGSRFGGPGTARVLGSDDFDQVADALAAAKRVVGDILGGEGLYSGGAAVVADLGDGTLYPAFRALLYDDSGQAWAFRATVPTSITFAVTAASPGKLYLRPVTAVGGGGTALVTPGGVANFELIANAATDSAPTHSLLLGSGTIVASTFTTWTPAAVAPGAPLISGGVTSFNTRSGAVTLTKADVTGTGLAAADVGADASGAAASAQSAAQSYADTNKLAKSSNLSDVANAATARTNLGLGTAATHASTDFDSAGAAATVAGNLTTHIGLANPHSTKLTNLSDVTVSTVSASVGNAIALNGAQAVLDGTTGFLDSAQYVVYSCWAKIHTVPGAGQCGILTDYNSDGSKGGGIWLYNGNLYGQMLTSAGAVQTDPVSPPSLDTWHYFELVKSNWSGAGVVALYVDGSLANNKSCFNAATLGTGTGAMRVGSIGITGFDGYFDGSVDEARIGKGTARQTSDVVASYNGGFGIPLSADSNNKVWSFDNALPAGSSLTSGTATYTLGVIGPTSGGTPYVPAYRVATWEANDGPLVNSRALTSVGGSSAYAGNIPTLGNTGIIAPTMLDLTSYALLNGSSQAFLGTHVFVNGGLARVRDTKYGPPTSGAHIVGARWTDAGGSEWECTVAGTPGTWVQNTPAAIATWSNLTTAGNWNGGALLAGYMARDLAMADTTEVWSYHATFGWRGRMAHFASTNGFVSATSTTGMSSNSSPNGAFDKDVKYLWHNFRTISYNGGSNLVGFDGSNYSTVRPAFLGNDGNTTYWGSVTNTINSTTPATLDGSEPASSGDVFDPAAHLQFYFRLTVTGTPTTGSHASRISAWRIHR